MLNKTKLFYLVFLFLFSPLIYGEKGEKIQEHTKLWFNGNFSGPLSKQNEKVKYIIESRFRLIDDLYLFDHLRLSAGIGYEFIPSITGYAGFGYVMDESTSGVLTHEDRPFQLLKWDLYRSSCVTFTNNSLLEERKQIESPGWAYRLRERFALEIPMPLNDWEKHSLELSNEFFLNLNHPRWVARQFYSENRAIIGFDTKLSKSTKLMVGYINQYQIASPKNKLSNGLIISYDVKIA